MDVKVAISSECLSAFAKIPRKAQSGVLKFFTKFQNDPKSPGINYEKINDAADKAYRSVRIDQNFRGIVRKPEEGATFLLLYVAKHDDAYDWARRKKCQINTYNGAMQVFEAIDRERDFSPTLIRENAKENSTQLTISLSKTQLLKLGIPEEYIDIVQAIKNELELEKLQDKLPVEAFEAAYLAAMGESWEQLEAEYCKPTTDKVDPNDFEKALARNVSKRVFKVVEGEEELRTMLDRPLEHWRIFLHSSQRKLVEKYWNGPVRILGGAGTGKTVVAIHRAKWLVKNVLKDGEKLLFTTYTANLAIDIYQNLKKICSAEELNKIEVTNIDKWIADTLKNSRYNFRLLYKTMSDYDFFWQRALKLVTPDISLPNSFYREELDKIIIPQKIDTLNEYLRASRVGRGVRLPRAARKKVWPVFEAFRTQLEKKGYKLFNQATLELADFLSKGRLNCNYRAVIVDEAQDMSTESLRMLRALVPSQNNDLFLVGDGHQRIYANQAALSKSGINIRGRGNKLKINYRTTEQIERYAKLILEDIQIDDLDGSLDNNRDYYSLIQGSEPIIGLFKNTNEEFNWIFTHINDLVETGTKLADICVVTRTKRLRDQLALYLKKAGLEIVELKQNGDERTRSGVRLATMHRVKGLEFRYVFISSVNEGVIPLNQALNSTDDHIEKQARELNERALLHVASTRAIKQLYLSSSGTPSSYLSNII